MKMKEGRKRGGRRPLSSKGEENEWPANSVHQKEKQGIRRGGMIKDKLWILSSIYIFFPSHDLLYFSAFRAMLLPDNPSANE